MRPLPRILSTAVLLLTLSGLSLFTLSMHPIKPQPINMIPTPIYVGERITVNQTRWSVDNRTLWFTGVDIESKDYAYDLPTGQLTPLEYLPFTLRLTPEQQTTLQAFTDEAYPSPDGQYIIYTHVETYDVWRSAQRMAIGHLPTGQHVLLNIGIMRPTWVFWSDNSQSALIFGMGEGLSGVYGITNFSFDLMQVQATNLMNFQSGHHLYVDMSSDGTRALLRRWIYVSSDTGLYLWDNTRPHEPRQFMAKDSTIIFDGDRVVGAAFMGEDSEMIIGVTDAGVVLLNNTTNQKTVINPVINATWVEWSYFSPDQTYIAVIPREKNNFSCKLFVLPVSFSGDVPTMLTQSKHCSSYG